MTTTAAAAPETTSTRYIVMDAAAAMPGSCKGRYRRVAVIEIEAGFAGEPKMISERARGVARIVATWERLSDGRTERCAFSRALAEAETMAATLTKSAARLARRRALAAARRS